MSLNLSSRIFNLGLTILHEKKYQKLQLEMQKEIKIQKITPLRFNIFKAILLTTLIAATVYGLVLVLWYKWLRVKIWYSTCDIDDADYLYVQSECGNDDIQRIVRQQERVEFYFKKLKYRLNDMDYFPVVLNYESNFNKFISKKYLKSGISDQQAQQYLKQYGKNQHQAEFPGFFSYLANGALEPFFLCQYTVIILDSILSLSGYIMFGLINIGLSWLAISANYFLTGYHRLKQQTTKNSKIRVLRNSKFVQIQSNMLVPGDLFYPEGQILCDCVLVKGQVELNQTTMSGSSKSVWKMAANVLQQLQQTNRWIYDGSEILQNRKNALALVICTGFTTRRGRFIRTIMTKPLQASQTMISTLYFWLMTFTAAYLIYSISIFFIQVQNIPQYQIGTRFIDYLGWSFPPAFSIYCNLTYLFEIIRLKKVGIRSIVPDKTAEVCNMKLLCFDKTGTITQKVMEICRVFRVIDQINIMDITDQIEERGNQLVRKIFGTCHGIRYRTQGQNQQEEQKSKNKVNEIDEKLFQYSGYNIKKQKKLSTINFIQSEDKLQQLQVLRLNQFEFDQQSMSVLVKDNTNNKYYVFVKGSPQKIYQKSQLKIDGFEDKFVHLCQHGYITLGFGYKVIQASEVAQYLKLSRQKFQDKIITLGLVTFQNKLKPETKHALQKIMYSGIKPIMLTGDNIYTAIETSLKSGLITNTKKVLTLQGQNQHHLLQQYSYKRVFKGHLISHHGHSVKIQQIQIKQDQDYLNLPYFIAVDGNFIDMDPHPKINSHISIFARSTPQQKTYIIKQLRSDINKQYQKRSVTSKIFGQFKNRVGMCGDGANDLMAIRQADVGIGINGSDSIAGSTFGINNLLDIDQLIRDNKAATVNIVEMTLYYDFICFLKIPASFIMMTDSAAYFSDNQSFFINYASTMIYPVLLAMSKPEKSSTHTTPNGNVMSPINLVKFWGSLIIATAGLIGGYFYFMGTEEYIGSQRMKAGEKWNTFTSVGTCIFLLVLPNFSIYPLYFYIGQPWKQKIYKNIPLLILLILNCIACVVIFFSTKLAYTHLNTYTFSTQTSAVLLLISFGSLLIGYIFNMGMEEIMLTVQEKTVGEVLD